MGTEAARYAFASLALSGRLHRLLDRMGERQHRRHAQDVLAFDAELDSALSKIARKAPAVGDDAHGMELSLIRQDFEEIERLYAAYKERDAVPEGVAQRFDRIFDGIREKLKEKGF